MKKVQKLGKGFIYQESKSGRFRAGYTIGYDGQGRQVRKMVSADTEAEAIEKRNRLAAQLLTEGYGGRSITLASWAKKWLEEIAFDRLSPNVFVDYRSKMGRYIVPTLGEYRLEDIGPDEVRELHRVVKAAQVSGRTVQIVHTVLSTCLQDAVWEGEIEANPCGRVQRPRARSREREALTVPEAKKVLTTAAAENDPLTTFWAAALMTGARRSELIGLETNRMELDTGLGAGVDISWQLQTLPWEHGAGCKCVEGRKAYLCPTRRHQVPDKFIMRPCVSNRVWTTPKTGSSIRWTPLATPLNMALTVYMQRGFQPNKYGLVWATANGLPLGLKTVSAGWKAALKRAGVRNVEFHSARHTTASLLLEAGVTPEVIAQILGHSSIATTQGYMHVNRNMAVDAMNRLGELFA